MRRTTILAIVVSGLGAHCAWAMDTSGPARAAQAKCVAIANAHETAGLLATVPTSADDLRGAERLFRRAHGCDRSLLRGHDQGDIPVETRGLLAEQLLTERPLPETLPGQGTRRFGDMSQVAMDNVGANRATLFFYDVSSCVADRNWPATRELLGTAQGSAEERAAFAPLMTSYQACLNGVTRMAVPPLFARAAMAEEVWHRLNPAQVAAR